jgi:hypothetical protein
LVVIFFRAFYPSFYLAYCATLEFRKMVHRKPIQ